MLFQLFIGQSGAVVLLNPLHSSRGQIWGGADTFEVWQNLESDVADFESEGVFAVIPSANGEEFSADFPDIRIAPLDDVGCGRQGGAEGVEFGSVHIGLFRVSPRGQGVIYLILNSFVKLVPVPLARLTDRAQT